MFEPPFSLGKTDVTQGLIIPGIVATEYIAPIIIAPVFPAPANPEISPFFNKLNPIPMLELGLVLNAFIGCSPIPMYSTV